MLKYTGTVMALSLLAMSGANPANASVDVAPASKQPVSVTFGRVWIAVVDQNGGSIPGASVRLFDLEAARLAPWIGYTNSAGRYSAALPIPTKYRVEVSWNGLKATQEFITSAKGLVITLPTACYANCDNSTVAPILNVADYICFINKFEAGDSYANCDGSTTPPVLNVNDLVCFLNRLSASCGAKPATD
jgi:hypothetical protein